jgi:hypothetical protein
MDDWQCAEWRAYVCLRGVFARRVSPFLPLTCVRQGYTLSAILNCAQQFLRLLPAPAKGGEAARHVDPMHVAATYLAAAAAAPYECGVRVVKRGRAYTHLEAELAQLVSGLHCTALMLRAN